MLLIRNSELVIQQACMGLCVYRSIHIRSDVCVWVYALHLYSAKILSFHLLLLFLRYVFLLWLSFLYNLFCIFSSFQTNRTTNVFLCHLLWFDLPDFVKFFFVHMCAFKKCSLLGFFLLWTIFICLYIHCVRFGFFNKEK